MNDTSHSREETGIVVASFGRRYEVAPTSTDANTRAPIQCVPKGKKSLYACGDLIRFCSTSHGQGVITGVTERRNLLWRSDAFREKLIAANLDLVVIVVATEPGFSDLLVSRCLAAATHEGIDALIVLNKSDITERLAFSRKQLEPYKTLGYRCIEISALSGAKELLPFLEAKTSILVGQSGMGKSTLINALIPEACAATREISEALDSGKHTTTFARRYPLTSGGYVIDSPGMQAFGLAHIPQDELISCFLEFKPLTGQCRFRDCKHQSEPGCAFQAALAAGTIHPRRWQHFTMIRDETSNAHQQRRGW